MVLRTGTRFKRVLQELELKNPGPERQVRAHSRPENSLPGRRPRQFPKARQSHHTMRSEAPVSMAILSDIRLMFTISSWYHCPIPNEESAVVCRFDFHRVSHLH